MSYLVICFVLFVSCGHCSISNHFKPCKDKIAAQSIPNVDYIYVINLDHRPEKYQQTLEEFAPYGIVTYRFSAANAWKLPIENIWDVNLEFKKGMRPGGMGTVYKVENGKEYSSSEIIEKEGTRYLCHCTARGAIGCILSHLSVMNDALQSGYGIVWICEDDIEVVRNPRLLSQYINDLDRIVGRDNWDVFFTFRDYLGPGGQYYTPFGANYRPNIDTRDQNKFNINIPISDELRQVGSRFGTQSMIWTRSGIEKVLKYYEEYKIFLPYDLDLVVIPGIKMYSVLEDVVGNKLDALSDLGSTSEK